MNSKLTPTLDQVICESNDSLSIEQLARLRQQQPGRRLTALFMDDTVAALFDNDPQVIAVAWGPVLGQMIADELPPSPPQFVAPPIVVLGDGAAARFISQAYVESWSEPGQPLALNCVGSTADWAHEVREEAAERAAMTWTQLPLRPALVAGRVAELIDLWDAPKPKHATRTGPTVIIALEADDVAMAIGARVAREITDARVAVVVRDSVIWPPVPSVQVFSMRDAQYRALTNRSGQVDRFMQLLLDDTAWLSAPDAEVTHPKVPIFAEVARDDSHAALPLLEQSVELQTQFAAISESAEQILAKGEVILAEGFSSSATAVILTPDELSAMAEEILRVLEIKETAGARLAGLELAARLVSLVSRSGRTPTRPAGYESLLTFAKVETLAPFVHEAYQKISVRSGYATNSPLAFEMWDQVTEFYRASNRAVVVGCAVAHAAEGLSWRAGERPKPYPLSDDQIDHLAELEHRRWAIHQRRNGAGDRDWMLPWPKVKESVKDYDRHIMASIPAILADGGIEIYQAQQEAR